MSQITKSHYDVCIIGGGLTGIVTAYFLAKSGKKIILLEKGKLGSGDTAATTAMVTQVYDTPLTTLASQFGKDAAKKVWGAGIKARNTLETIIAAEKIDCDFRNVPAYIFAPNVYGISQLDEEYELASILGFDIKLKYNGDLKIPNVGYLEVPDQALFNPIKFIKALAEIIKTLGGEILENTEATEIYDEDLVEVYTKDKGQYNAEKVIVATHYPFNAGIILQGKLQQYQTYVVVGSIPKDILPDAMFWDTNDPYTYFRVDPGLINDTLTIGGSDQKVGKTTSKDNVYENLLNYISTELKISDFHEISRRSGNYVVSDDSLPYIGSYGMHRDILIATGFQGNGMTFGVLSAEILKDYVLGIKNSYADLFTANRLGSPITFIRNGLSEATEFAKSFIESRKSKFTSLNQNDGIVTNSYGKPIAIYKDKDGNITKMSAFCTHMNCIVNWNGEDKTWDCPCHGSRFSAEGAVLHGPAVDPLKKID